MNIDEASVNGAARTNAGAPDGYREQELAAQVARRGLRASLPPPPETLTHPILRDTATLQANGRTCALDGISGFDSGYAGRLQDDLAAKGDSLTCSPQGAPGRCVCVLPDGTDIALVALGNGMAQIGPDAFDAYRLQQTEAINRRRGYWLSTAELIRTAGLAAAATASATPTACRSG